MCYQSKLTDPDVEEPYHYVYQMCRDKNTQGYRLLIDAMNQVNEPEPLNKISTYVREESVNAATFNTYVADLNPSLSVLDAYSTDKYIPDIYRTSIARLRLMSHKLRVEMGRWHPTPANLRTCLCDKIAAQTEEHVLMSCPLLDNCRNRYQILDFRNVNSLMSEKVHVVELCKYVHDVRRIYLISQT